MATVSPSCRKLSQLMSDHVFVDRYLQVLLAVVEVGGVPDVALALGIAETTVKFHLRQLFSNLGTLGASSFFDDN